jgi:hypothetical protein
MFTGQLQDGFNHMLSFRPGDKHGRRDNQVHAPEFLVAGDVLGGHATGTFGQGLIIACDFVFGQPAIAMGIQVRTVATQHKRRQQLGVHSRRAYVRVLQALHGGLDGLAKLHGISSQYPAPGSQSLNAGFLGTGTRHWLLTSPY